MSANTVRNTAKRNTRKIELTGRGGASGSAFVSVPECGSGPGLIVLSDGPSLDDAMRARCVLFAEEGYVVLAPEIVDDADTGQTVEALRSLPEYTGKVAAIGYGAGARLAHRAALDGLIDGAVLFDLPDVDTIADETPPCPLTFQFALGGDGALAAVHDRVRDAYRSAENVTVHAYPLAAPGFTIPGHPAYDKPASRIAHTRTLELLRRELGPRYDLVAIFQEHLKYEFETRDADATMATMVGDPYVNHVPTLTGGVGHDMLKRFYKYHFIPQNSADRKSVHVSYTVGVDRLVIETVSSFTHAQEIDHMFPGVPPTGKYVEIPIVILVNFRGNKVCHEHIYWDQASALAQLGVIDPTGLPISGPEQARKLLDEEMPSNELMDNWKSSEGKPL